MSALSVPSRAFGPSDLDDISRVETLRCPRPPPRPLPRPRPLGIPRKAALGSLSLVQALEAGDDRSSLPRAHIDASTPLELAAICSVRLVELVEFVWSSEASRESL